ncbi:tetratricopeptide repeat protein [Streptomyces sp. 35G-GA-8]|uniref:tetratricopeptide repeat protein n=1 Tax=Streptomyces sp. 35G-GA-8 TaxID=2939434 RepID=UPI00201EAE26|nr:tetratricopeptide repeat protein [Streptomyces sp. 35G-GA-8]MCL7381291.1 tetratricopeptide repeat protein [Streptomyces sp. 35G-GA-8]
MHLGRIHLASGRPEKAVNHFSQAGGLFALYGDPHAEALALGNMGGPLILLGRYRKALDVCQEALHLADGDDGRYHRGIALANMGGAYMGLGLMDTALSCYSEGAQLFQQLGDHQNLVTTLANMSSILTQQGEFTRAREMQQRAESSLRRLNRTS